MFNLYIYMLTMFDIYMFVKQFLIQKAFCRNASVYHTNTNIINIFQPIVECWPIKERFTCSASAVLCYACSSSADLRTACSPSATLRSACSASAVLCMECSASIVLHTACSSSAVLRMACSAIAVLRTA